MAASQWTFATAVDTAKALANREISSVELTQLAIDRIARHDDKINAICVRDFERALEAAHAADASLARGERRARILGLAPETHPAPAAHERPDARHAAPVRGADAHAAHECLEAGVLAPVQL